MASRRGQWLGCLLAGALAGGALAADEGERAAQGAALPASAARAGEAGRVNIPRASNEESCLRRWREYQDSQACFMPYITSNGIKQEAFAACGPELLDPSPDCGPAPPQE